MHKGSRKIPKEIIKVISKLTAEWNHKELAAETQKSILGIVEDFFQGNFREKYKKYQKVFKEFSEGFF